MKHSTLSTLEKQLISKLELATATLKEATQKIDSYRKETEQLRAKLNDSPSLPAGFKVSQATKEALATSKAQLATAQKMLQEEIDHYYTQVVQDISQRNAKAVADREYQKALNGPYAVAVKAISAKRQEVQHNGVDVLSGISGYSFKALFDSSNKSLFTFELISDPDLEIQGQSYRITKSVISPIGAGNVYHLSLVRPA